MNGILAPHPWDKFGSPPPVGKPYADQQPEKVEPKADLAGFTDSTGRHIDYEAGVVAAARCILDQPAIDAVKGLVRDCLSPTDILEWIIYPDTGVFADDVR